MEVNKINRISLIGAGNVATHIATRFFQNEIQIIEVWSKHGENAVKLAEKVNAKVCLNLSDIDTNIDLLVISVRDDAMNEVLSQLPFGINALVHTSGSLDMQLLKGKATSIGVLYPLQSFNKTDVVDWENVPVCVEANTDSFTEQLFELGKQLNGNVQYINSTQRVHLHIAAVIANNFTNYLYSLSHELTVDQKISFSLLLPLIKQTANRLTHNDPFLLQTGPANRHDVELIKKHIDLLKDHPEAAEVYEFLSNKIIKKAGN